MPLQHSQLRHNHSRLLHCYNRHVQLPAVSQRGQCLYQSELLDIIGQAGVTFGAARLQLPLNVSRCATARADFHFDAAPQCHLA